VTPDLEQVLINYQWQAGKKDFFSGEENFAKNPWVFNPDHTFITLRDKHHGTWSV